MKCTFVVFFVGTHIKINITITVVIVKMHY